jgi:hypothetical protein
MKASVSLITYNHAPFIAQAIESVPEQRTTFDFKYPLGDWPLHVLNAQHGRIGYLDEVIPVTLA